MWLLSGLWHVLIMGDYYSKRQAIAEPNMLFIILAYAILALLMTYIFPQGYKGGAPLKEGLRFGATMGLLWILPLGVIMHAVQGTSGKLILIDSLWHVVEQGVGGIVIAYIYGLKKA
ncbi:hypothetical protein ACFLSS_02810 [Bacteroidota bacterium]